MDSMPRWFPKLPQVCGSKPDTGVAHTPGRRATVYTLFFPREHGGPAGQVSRLLGTSLPPPHTETGAEPRSAALLWNSLCFSILPGSHIFDELKITPKLRSIWGDSNANILNCLVNFENYDSRDSLGQGSPTSRI